MEPAYEAKKYENKIYKKWEKSLAFIAKPNKDKKPFTISMPPPNATGVLHLGHAAFLTIEDIFTRYHRMKGYEALWLPGTDHAAIATQNRVEKDLAKEGLHREKIGREKFLERVREFVAGSQDTIRNQVRRMGASCDWSRERYTLDNDLSEAVTEMFNRMYEDGLIYRGHRIVNWCPRCKSTLADDEVEHEERKGKFYWIKYGPFLLATTRPETKLGDTAVAVHPEDKRYKDMIGKKFKIPGVLGDFEITVVGDKEVKKDFGSGAVKVTPAHSFVDFEIAQRHNLPIKKIINEEGRMMDNCGKYAGLTTIECRDEIVKDMKKMGLIEKIEEDYENSVALCYRCNSVIEPLTSDQWFIDVNKKFKIKDNSKLKFSKDKASLKELSLHVVKNKSIEIIPARFEKTYYHWMENLHNWCISRQIWWGHQIPVWYCEKCKKPIVSRKTPKSCPHCKSSKLKQDEDTLDTWFSSALWTFSTLGWPKETPDLKYFHPTSLMETGYDILFFWVARMILMTTYGMNDIPFEKVYLHGLIRTREGKKMSKSDPSTCIDPLEMIDKYGTDALRMSIVVGTTPGNDSRLYEEKIKGYRNFVNKLWNASRFVLGILEEHKIKEEPKIDKRNLSDSDQWILSSLNSTIQHANKGIKDHRIGEVGQNLYDFLWGDFCDWYLELSKGDKQNPAVLYHVLKNILTLLHPFIPFVTEQIWGSLPGQESMLINEPYPEADKEKYDNKKMSKVIKIINKIRNMRAENKVEPVKKINVTLTKADDLKSNAEEIKRIARIKELTFSKKTPSDSIIDTVDNMKVAISKEGLIDTEKERARLTKEIEKTQKIVTSLESKLSQKGFIERAPEKVIEVAKKNLETEKSRLKTLQKELDSL